MKRLILLIFVFFPMMSIAQEGYIFSKEQHEQIKKNLDDYKILIKEYDLQSEAFEECKRELYAIQKTQTTEYKILKLKYDSLQKLHNIAWLLKENQELKLKLELSNKEIKYKTRMMYHFEWKYNQERKKRKKPAL
jgi:hypothetical protein